MENSSSGRQRRSERYAAIWPLLPQKVPFRKTCRRAADYQSLSRPEIFVRVVD